MAKTKKQQVEETIDKFRSLHGGDFPDAQQLSNLMGGMKRGTAAAYLSKYKAELSAAEAETAMPRDDPGPAGEKGAVGNSDKPPTVLVCTRPGSGAFVHPQRVTVRNGKIFVEV